MSSFEPLLRSVLTSPTFLIGWVVLSFLSVALLWYDLIAKNGQLPSLMKTVWTFTVLYSGLLGLAIYYYSGRQQIAHDSIWRKGFRSTAHCYSGCGAGEITGVFITAGLLSLGNWWITGVTFALAYVFGFLLTIGPLMQDGEPFHKALRDALYSETASITVMELVALGVDLYLGGNAKMDDLIFWSSLVFSLTMGLLAAYPVNVLLIYLGVKEGMHSPKMNMQKDRKHEGQAKPEKHSMLSSA